MRDQNIPVCIALLSLGAVYNFTTRRKTLLNIKARPIRSDSGKRCKYTRQHVVLFLFFGIGWLLICEDACCLWCLWCWWWTSSVGKFFLWLVRTFPFETSASGSPGHYYWYLVQVLNISYIGCHNHIHHQQKNSFLESFRSHLASIFLLIYVLCIVYYWDFMKFSWNFFLEIFDVCVVACDLSSLLLCFLFIDFTLQLDTTPNCPVSKPRRWRISVENSKTDVAWMSWADGSWGMAVDIEVPISFWFVHWCLSKPLIFKWIVTLKTDAKGVGGQPSQVKQHEMAGTSSNPTRSA